MRWTRRHLLAAAVAVGVLPRAVCAGASSPVAVRGEPPKRIALRNLHTKDHIEVEYARGGQYIPDALASIGDVLRDFRSGETHAIDPALVDYLSAAAAALNREAVFSVISGYRSPESNALLRQRSSGVAEHSLHMQGRAIDVRMTGIDCADLAHHAEGLRRGGVGYYRASNFVHLDTGAFRTWRG